MTGLKPRVFKPNPKANEIYKQLYPLYRKVHDAFGTTEWNGNLSDVMKQLIEIRSRVRKRGITVAGTVCLSVHL
jgi:L-ribulokinase